jgi:hypothetical protein
MIRSLIAICLFLNASAIAQTPKWSENQANDWYSKQPWLVGSNYIPATAINQLEMWQAETFDTTRIDMELGWAEGLGMNTMRVFLHDIPWQQDSSGYRRRIDRFLAIAKKHKIRPILVLFDSCWFPFPEAGIQPVPRRGVHNSGWVQSPGAKALTDPGQETRILNYVQEVILAFSTDDRILAWDLWNEPDNPNSGSYAASEPRNKLDRIKILLPQVFKYARAGLPTQPLTSGLWKGGDWSADKLDPIEKIQIELSDVISFHSYGNPEEFEKRVQALQAYHRPILATEYMARGKGSTFQGILPLAKQNKVAAYNWGFAAGKTQTWLPWDSWQHPYTDREPEVWFHDIFFSNGKPYLQEEVDFIRSVTAGKAPGKTTAHSLKP